MIRCARVRLPLFNGSEPSSQCLRRVRSCRRAREALQSRADDGTRPHLRHRPPSIRTSAAAPGAQAERVRRPTPASSHRVSVCAKHLADPYGWGGSTPVGSTAPGSSATVNGHVGIPPAHPSYPIRPGRRWLAIAEARRPRLSTVAAHVCIYFATAPSISIHLIAARESDRDARAGALALRRARRLHAA